MKQKSFSKLSNVDLIKARIKKTFFEPIICTEKPYKRLDFSKDLGIDLNSVEGFNTFVFNELLENNTKAGIGGYLEKRVIYSNKVHFGKSDEARNVHLGVDIWLPAGEAIYAPCSGTIHSFKNNANYGDYGPTLILKHEIEGLSFHTLYGHLSKTSIVNKALGMTVQSGDEIGWIGPYPENGNWPPHLHFQVIIDLQGLEGDYPGVCHTEDLAFYRENCPDPECILGSISSI